MTYCVGIRTQQGLVLASDSRTNSGIDQVEVCRKMHNFVIPGERMFTILSSGSLSLTQSVMTRLDQDFRAGDGLASVTNFYEAARCVGQQVRAVGALDREYMERDNINFSVNLLVGGQIRGEMPQLYLIYAQGNPLRCTRLSPFLQIGESKYGRPILDRGIRFGETTLDQAVTYAIISLDSTMRSNVAVGPPIDLLVYANDDLSVKRYRRLDASDPSLGEIRSSWEQALRHAIKTVPQIHFDDTPPREQLGVAFTRDAGKSVGSAGAVSDDDLVALCQELIAANPKIVADVRGGKEQAAAGLIGQAKKKNPNANPGKVRQMCLDLIKAM